MRGCVRNSALCDRLLDSDLCNPWVLKFSDSGQAAGCDGAV